MLKERKTRDEFEQIIVIELRNSPHCEQFGSFSVRQVAAPARRRELGAVHLRLRPRARNGGQEN